MRIPLSLIIFLLLHTATFGIGKEKPVLDSLPNDTLTVNCDSFYAQKGYSIQLIRFEFDNEGYDGEKNAVFIFRRQVNGIRKEIFRDTIFTRMMEVDFADYNNDNVRDILIQNIADVRSNLTWYLYFFEPKTGTLKKVKGFEEIKSPRFNAKYNIVENYVMSGTNWTSLYAIKNKMVIDYDILIYDKEDAKGVNHYESEYKKAIKKIIRLRAARK